MSVDFIVGTPVSHRKCHPKPHNALLVVVDQYTKLVCYFPCHNTLVAVGLTEILTRKLVLRGTGVP
jgi:hypothetical protein